MVRMCSALYLLQARPLSLIFFGHFSTVGLTVIRVPRALQLRVERVAKDSSRRRETRRPVLASLPGRLLIKSRRPELNQHTAYTFSRIGRPPRLVSQGWKHRLATGDHFTVNNTRESVPSLPEIGEGKAPNFSELGICPALVQTLSSRDFEHPTVVQSQTIPRLLRGYNVLCAAETGSGKTLCYLLPLLQRLVEEPSDWKRLVIGTQGWEGMSTEDQGYNDDTFLIFKGQIEHGISTDAPFSNWQIKDHQHPLVVHPQDATNNKETPCDGQGSDKLQAKSFSSNTMVRKLARGERPQALVLVPSRELADQIYAVASKLTPTFSLKVKSIGGGHGMSRVQRALLDPPDILVATPGALCKALRKDLVTLQDLKYLVLDEADTLCDESFKELVEEILLQVNISRGPAEAFGPEGKAQLAVIGATFPKGVGELLQRFTDLGTITTIKSKRLHFLMPHVKQTFLKVKGADKLIELLNILKKREPGAGVLVFCNSAKTVNWLGYMLDSHTVQHLRLQGLMPADMRTGIFNSFQKGLNDVLVCSDIASRGLDSTRVDLVVNYDFPPSLQDYIHRAGRVGRVGSKNIGTVISFVTHKWDVELVQKIEIAARRRASLPGMVSSINQPIRKTDLVQFDSEAEI